MESGWKLIFCMGRREAKTKMNSILDSYPFQLQRNSSIASPLLSERVCSAILRSLCAEEGKMHGKAVVACLEKQQLIINIAGEEAIFSFADAVDVANYDARGMMDDFFPRYPYKTTRNSSKYFKAWVTDGTGQLYKEFCVEWIELAQKFLRECSSCRACSRKPTSDQLLQVFGTVRPYYIRERPRCMYSDDDQVVLESELYPVAGGLVVEGTGPEVKEEIQDAPPGYALPLTKSEISGPSGVKGAQAEETQLMAQSDKEEKPAKEEEIAAGSQSRGDPMLLDPAVMLLANLPGSTCML